MARRSSSSRWSRPATGKQIAALKAHGGYDGKYYSMGRASQAIGGSGRSPSSSGPRSGGSLSSGSAYSLVSASGLGSSGLLAQLFGGSDDLDSSLESSLGPSPQSRLASSGSGPTNLLSELLGVPDDIGALVEVALAGAGSDQSSAPGGDDPVESVLFTVRSDDSDPDGRRIVVEAEVIQDSAFDGSPSLGVRFAEATKHGADGSNRIPQSAGHSTLGYRPRWAPALVRTPVELAAEMRLRWGDAMQELHEGVDDRMITFLAGFPGTEVALKILKSRQSPASKFVLLQGILDPGGPVEFHGFSLDAATFAEQIRAASEGDEDALSWFEAIQREQVLTSFAEVTGNDVAAEADFRLSRWREQGMKLMDAVTMKAEDAAFDFAPVRRLLTMEAESQTRNADAQAQVASTAESWPGLADRLESALEAIQLRLGHFGILEDWFFEETRNYLQTRFRQSLPGQFAAAFARSSADGRGYPKLAQEVRRLATESSTDPKDYSAEPASVVNDWQRLFPERLAGRSHLDRNAFRTLRIAEAVRCAITAAETAGDDDLGTLIVAQEVLAYARWKREELRAQAQIREVRQHSNEAAERRRAAQQRSDAARGLIDRARKGTVVAKDVERTLARYEEALAGGTCSIDMPNPFPDSARSVLRARLKQAKAREAAAAEWLATAEDRERWVAAEEGVAATSEARERLRAERQDASAEQAEARAEQQAARDEQRTAQRELAHIDKMQAKFEELSRPIREENEKRLRLEAERRQREWARQADENRKRIEVQAAERERRQAAEKRQAEANQQQQDRARAAKAALIPELERLQALPGSAPFWRRRALAATRSSLERSILGLQNEIVGPLVPPRTGARVWPSVLSPRERYLGTVKKSVGYGSFVSLPAGADGLLRGLPVGPSLSPGQLVIVEIVDMPLGKPIVLKLISR